MALETRHLKCEAHRAFFSALLHKKNRNDVLDK